MSTDQHAVPMDTGDRVVENTRIAFDQLCASHRKHFTDTLQTMTQTLSELRGQQSRMVECQVRFDHTITIIGQDVAQMKRILLGNGDEGIDERVRDNTRRIERYDTVVRSVFGDLWRAVLPVAIAAIIGATTALFTMYMRTAQ